MSTDAVSYQLMLQQSNKTAQRICCPSVSTAFFPRPLTLLFTHQYLYRIHTEHCLLPLCMYVLLPEWGLPPRSTVSREPLCLCDWHVAVGVAWLSHCHSLAVMRKSTLDLPLWSALLEDLRELSPCLVRARRSQQRAPDTREPARQPELLSSSQTGAIKFSPHYLRQSHHRLVLAGEGKRKKGVGGWWHQSLSVCECVFY